MTPRCLLRHLQHQGACEKRDDDMVVDQDGLNARNLGVSTVLEMISRCEFDLGRLTSDRRYWFSERAP